MKPTFNRTQLTAYIISAFLFIVHQFLEQRGTHFKFLDDYLDVFLFPLLLMPLVLSEVRFILKDLNYTLSGVKLFSYFLLLSLISELVFPALSARFTFDWFDVVAIGLGMIFFQLVYNRPAKN